MGERSAAGGSPGRPALRAAAIVTALAFVLALSAGAAGCGDGEPGSEDDVPSPTTAAETDPSTAAEPGGRDRSFSRNTTKRSGSRDGSGTGVPANPAEAARLFLVSGDAERVCGSVLDPDFLRATYGDLSGCVAARRPPTLARDPGLGEPRVAEGSARLTANPRGGLYDDQRLTFTIGEAEDGWRIERITSNVQVGP